MTTTIEELKAEIGRKEAEREVLMKEYGALKQAAEAAPVHQTLLALNGEVNDAQKVVYAVYQRLWRETDVQKAFENPELARQVLADETFLRQIDGIKVQLMKEACQKDASYQKAEEAVAEKKAEIERVQKAHAESCKPQHELVRKIRALATEIEQINAVLKLKVQRETRKAEKRARKEAAIPKRLIKDTMKALRTGKMRLVVENGKVIAKVP